MKLSLKLCLSCLALVLFGAALGVFGASFVDYKGIVSGTTSLANGFEIAFGQTDLVESGKNVGTLFAFIFVAVGLLSSCYALLVSLKKGKKKSKAAKNAKLLCSLCSFVVCGLVPALLLFLTLQTTGLAGNASVAGRTIAETKLGIGAILSAVFTLVGACSLSLAELK